MVEEERAAPKFPEILREAARLGNILASKRGLIECERSFENSIIEGT